MQRIRSFEMNTYQALVISLVLIIITNISGGTADHLDELEEIVKRLSEKNDTKFDKCCKISQVYSIGMDSCETRPSFTNQTDFEEKISNENSSIWRNLGKKLPCPTGYSPKSLPISQVTYRGSSLLVLADGTQLEKPIGFCLDESDGHEEDEPIARFCVPDPCLADGAKCVYKCCPVGMVINHELSKCQTYTNSTTFDIPFRHLNGTPADRLEDVILRHGVFPSCPHGMYVLGNEEFAILPDGEMHFPHLKKPLLPKDSYDDDYCLDHFLEDNGALTIRAIKCFPEQSAYWNETNSLALTIYPYTLFFSSIFLLATFFVYALLPELHNAQGLMVMAYVASMSVMFVGLGTIQTVSSMGNLLCIGLAVLVHYTFLATFAWMNALSFDIWRSLRFIRSSEPENTKRRILCSSIYAWGIPAVIVIVGQVLDNVKEIPDHIIRPQFGTHVCWFYERGSFYAYLYGPISFFLLTNIFFFIASSYILYTTNADSSLQRYQAKRKFVAILVLFVVMGVTWTTEVISFAFEGLSSYAWIPTDILNIMNGVFVFLVFVCNRHIWKLLSRKYPNLTSCLKKTCCCCCQKSRKSAYSPQEASAYKEDETTFTKAPA